MAYDLLIKNGRIIDGSGMPSFHGDVAVKDGKVFAMGKLDGPAQRTIDADGRVIAPGIIDNHCHYDAQATWDPLCSYSCYHGVTTVVIGNCSLAIAPARESDREVLTGIMSRVEAIPLEVLQAGTAWSWETIPEYLDALDRRLGLNVGSLMGHSAIRRYAMGEASQEREATGDEIETMQAIIREGLRAGALGLSFEYNLRHFDMRGKLTPSNLATVDERLALAQVLGQEGTGVVQFGGANQMEREEGVCSRMAEITGRPVIMTGISQSAVAPNRWKEELDLAAATMQRGLLTYRMVNPRPNEARFTPKNAQHFDSMATWKPIMMLPPDEKKRAFMDPEIRRKLHFEAVETPPNPEEGGTFSRRWDLCFVHQPALEKNAGLKGKSVVQIAEEQGKDVLDAFLDLAVEEDLETSFVRREGNSDEAAMTALLTSPYTVIGLSDGGAHVVFRTDYSYSTYFLSHWVREKGIMPLEEAVRKLTFVPASIFGIHGRGLLRPGLAADIVVFDPDTIAPLEPEEAQDLPGGGTRRKQLAEGVACTVVNGQVLIENGEHTGALPGRVARNSAYQANGGAL